MSITDIHRREGMKETDLVKEELPTERALGVLKKMLYVSR